MRMKTLLPILLMTSYCLGQSPGSLLNGSRGIPYPNDATGTTLYGTAIITTAGAAETAPANATGPVRIVVGGAGTSGNAILASTGTLASCTMDAAVTSAGNFFVIAGAAGQCHPQSAAPTAGTWVIGYLHDPSTTLGGQSLVHVNGFFYSGTGGASLPSITDPGPANSGNAVTINNPVTIPYATGAAPAASLTVGASGTSVGSITFNNATAGGWINVAAPSGALGTRTYTWALPQSAAVNSATIPNTASANTWTAIQTFSNSAVRSGQASFAAASSAISNTETAVIAGTNIPANRIVLGTVLRFTWLGTCTATGTNTSTFTVHLGQNGTIADGVLASATTTGTSATGTAIPFRAVMEVTFYTVASGGPTGSAMLTVFNQGSTGIASTPVQVMFIPTIGPSGLNLITIATKLTMSYSSAGSTTSATFSQAFIEFVNQ